MKPTSSEQALFAEALLRDTPEARAVYLDSACGTDPALRQRLAALLRAAASAGDFLEEPPTVLGEDAAATQPENALNEKPGDRIGRYKLLEKIGEGGCGVVYMAEQEEPVRRRVALKVIKLGMDTRSVVARFEAERQALALMDHPNIAKVFDGGATQTGRPYFVMELVRGVRITEFCDEARLPTVARLRLFVQVCQAIQHAHQKGIIHRDLKPSNILVTINDGTPVPKVIDFGIAKATGQRLTDKTLFTQFHSFIGTPAYTSPEQAEMSSVDIDTRSDIYSLGVLLYELLTGRTPFDGEELLRSGLDEMRRIIRDAQPPRPSNRLDTLGLVEATELSGKRQTNVRELVSVVRGDLDWIVMKCLEKDRSRRYETANGIAADIQRHLANAPITARPPSAMYLLQKVAQRNRGALVAAALIFVTLLVAVVVLATSNASIRRERNQKDQALVERGTALEAARESEHRAREQLFVSLRSQAQARRNSRQVGQRVESLAALTEAAHIRPSAELRDNAIAALAIPDVQFGPSWEGWSSTDKAFAYDALQERYARLGPDGAISIRTITGDRELRRLEPSPLATADAASYDSLKFSPDGRLIVWLGKQGRLGLWRWESGESVLKSAPENCLALAFSPNGRRLAIGRENWIACFDLDSGEERRRWPAQDRIFKMGFHPDSRRLAVGYQSTNTIAVYDSDDGEQLASLPTDASRQNIVAWHPDGELLAAGGSDARIHIWNVNARRRIAVLEGHVGNLTSLSFHPRGDLLTSTAWDGILNLWHPSPGRLLLRVPTSPWLDWGGTGRWAGVISPSKNQAQLWGIVPSDEYHTFLNSFGSGAGELHEGDISPDGTLLALGAVGGVRLWDIARGREVAWLAIGETRTALFRADGRELLTCGPSGLQRWPLATNPPPAGGLQLGPPQPIALSFVPHRIAKSCAGGMLAVVDEGLGQAGLLNLATERVYPAVMAHEFACYVALAPDGKHVATSAWHSELVKLWDGPSSKLIQEWKSGKQSRAFFTPDGREMIVARGQEFTFHDLATLKVSRQMPRDRVLYPGYVAFTPDGKLMALEMSPGVIHLKDVSSGRTVARLEDPHGDQSSWMGFTPDGAQLIVAATVAGAIHRWDLRAIRARLKPMNLDWDWPEFSAPLPGDVSFSKSPRPFRMQVVSVATSATNMFPATP